MEWMEFGITEEDWKAYVSDMETDPWKEEE